MSSGTGQPGCSPSPLFPAGRAAKLVMEATEKMRRGHVRGSWLIRFANLKNDHQVISIIILGNKLKQLTVTGLRLLRPSQLLSSARSASLQHGAGQREEKESSKSLCRKTYG